MKKLKKIKNFVARAVRFIKPDGTDIKGPYWLLPDGKKEYIYEEWFKQHRKFYE